MTSGSERQTRTQMAAAAVAEPCVFSLLGRQWDLLPGVFSPAEFASTGYFASVVPVPAGSTFLEMGCGAGVLAMAAALSGAVQVLAVDINAAAVRNVDLNAKRHGVLDRVTALQSDLFDAVPGGARFDVIFWNSNFVKMPANYKYSSVDERAFFDPGYSTHARYFADAANYLAPGGRLYLGFSSLGDFNALDALAAENGLAVHTREKWRSTESTPTDYFLMELVPSHDGGMAPTDGWKGSPDDDQQLA